MALFLNHVAIAAPRNTLSTHTVDPNGGTVVTGSNFTPTAGRFLLVVIAGGVTSYGPSAGPPSVPPTGWTNQAEALSGTGLYCWTRTAAGSDTITVNHNASDYPVCFHWFEFAAGSTWIDDVTSTTVSDTGAQANPNLTGLSASPVKLVMGARAQAADTTATTMAMAWTGTGVTEILDHYVAYSTTEGYWLSICYVEDSAATSFAPSGTRTGTSFATTCEAITWAIQVAAPTGTATPAAIPLATTIPTASATGNLPIYVQGQNAAFTTTRSPAVTFSAGVQTGDVVYFYCSTSAATSAATAPSGWVNVLATSTTIVTSDANTAVGVYHIVTSGENGTTTFTATNLFDATATGNVLAAVLRNVDLTTPVDNFGSTFNSGNTITPHVLAAITGTGSALSANSLVVRGVSKDLTGSHTDPASHTMRQTSNSTSATWLGTRDALTTANTDVTATNITPNTGDEYCSISVAFTMAAGGATASPAVIARTVAVPAVTPQAGSTLSPAVIVRTVALPTAATGASATATPTAIARTVTVLAATPQAGVTFTPTAITLAVTIPAPTIGNPIPAENALAGYDVADWQVTGAGDLGAFGFTTTMSVQAGDDIDFKIHTGGDPYTLEIIRLGWYGGDGARLIDDTITNDGSTQSEGTLRTAGEGGTGTRDCSGWTVTDTWTVPADAVHGVYLGVIKRDGETEFAHVGPFVVHTGYSAGAQIVCKLSDMTWRAYNTFGTLAAPTGGKSLYGIGIGGTLISQANRAWDTSYDAPLVTAEGVPQTSYWNGEQPVHAFLERNGYDVAYASCLDVDADPDILLGRSVIISEGHDEYWSQNIRDAWDAAIDSGVHAIVASGNTMLWRVRMDGRRMVCYKDSHSLDSLGTGEDPVTWTGTWRDTRWPSRRPECESIGTLFVANGIRADEIILRAADAAEPLWRDTTAAALTGGSTETLKADCLGFEWDSYEPSYTSSMGYPPGLKLLSLTAVNLTGQAANEDGSTYADTINPADHHIVAFQRGTSVTVNFATNQWGWGLSDLHVRGATGENTTMKQATVNLLADLGCQPATLQSGLSAATDELDTWTWPTATALSLPSTASLAEAETEQLAATTTWTNGVVSDTADYATWDSTDDAVATVSTTGLITGISVGTATITATYGSASDTTTVTVTAASIYDHVWTGTDPVGATDAVAYEIGTYFTVSENTTIVGIRIWNPGLVDVDGNRIATLWTHNGSGGSETSVRTIDIPDLMDSGWSEHLFGTPYSATTSVNYCVSYWVEGDGTGGGQDYGAVSHGLDSAVTTGPITIPVNGGKFHVGGTAGANCPDDDFNNSFYGVDILYGGLDGTATPAVIARSMTIPAPTPQAGSSIVPPPITRTIAIPASTLQAGASVSPAATALTVALSAVTATGGGSATTTPTVIPLTVTIPAAISQAGATTGPTVIPLTVTLPPASASGASVGTTTPTVITTLVTLPTVTPRAGWTASPTPVTLAVTMPSVAAGASTAATPAVIPLTVNVRTATATGGTAATALPNVVALVTVTPSPTLQYGYIANPQAITLAVTIAAALASGIIPDANPITVTLRDSGHTITVHTIGTTATVRELSATATVRENR